MNAQRLVFFDLETGGLDYRRHPITQFAAVAVEVPSWKTVEELELKVKFDAEKATPEALALNGYDEAVWKETAVPETIAAKAVAGFFRNHATVQMTSKGGKAYSVARLAGHNVASFDQLFLREWFKRLDVFNPGHYLALDTLHLALWIHGGRLASGELENVKLQTLADYYGIQRNGEAHTALSDVKVNARVAEWMVNDVSKERVFEWLRA